MNDELWEHFKPLWNGFQAVDVNILVAGGYGLYLKQQWLRQQKDRMIVVPLDRWLNATPRVTKDLDLVIGLDLIADEAKNGQMLSVLEAQGFRVTGKAGGKRWQFVKVLENDRRVIAELHTSTPGDEHTYLKADKIRVKRKPSMGEEGVHGRLNPEAVGATIQPFSFLHEDTPLTLPNALTWSVMKITAAQDRWLTSQDTNTDEELRSFSRDQAIKHGNDVFRVVAMMSMQERDSCLEVKAAIQETPEFQHAAQIYRDFFVGMDDWADEVLKDQWLSEDKAIMHSVLASWFKA